MAAASRRQPGEKRESQAGASRNAATESRQPKPQRRLQKARLPFPRLRWHRKHFLGLSDSSPRQSRDRTALLLRRMLHVLEEKGLEAERGGANRRSGRARGRSLPVTAPSAAGPGSGCPPRLRRSRVPGPQPTAQWLGAAEGCEEGPPRTRRGNGAPRPPARCPPVPCGRDRRATGAMGANEDQEVRTQDWTPLPGTGPYVGRRGLTPRASFALRAWPAVPR